MDAPAAPVAARSVDDTSDIQEVMFDPARQGRMSDWMGLPSLARFSGQRMHVEI